MSRELETISRSAGPATAGYARRHLMRAWLPTLLSLALGCGRTDASDPAGDSKPAAPEVEAPAEPEVPDLSKHAFPLLVWTGSEVERDYFDKQRIDPRGQVVAAVEALGLHTPEFFGEVTGDTVRVRVRSATAEFALTDLTTLTAAAIRIEEILEFAQGILDLEPEALHELEYAAINGLFSPLDPHTVLLTPEQHTELGVRTKGEFGGVGAQIRSEARRILIVSVLPGMPADKAGVLAGDIILAIDGESTVNMASEEAQQRLRGPVGSKVVLKIQRGKKQLTVEVGRDTIRIESVRGVGLPDAIAYLGVNAFQEQTAAEARAQLEKLAAATGAPRGLVLDLRGNSGGVLTQASEMIDDLVARGELVVVRSAAGDEVAEAEAAMVLPETVPVVVLIDEESASAAEIVAGGLQALGRATVVGRTSFGKGTVQMVRPAAPYGRELALKLTLAEWLVAGGRHVQTAGVVPDVMLQPVELSGVAGVARFYDQERFERARERSRVAHLPSAAHELSKGDPTAEQRARRVTYLATPELPASLVAAAGATPLPRELADPEIRIAFELARELATVKPDRATQLDAVSRRLAADEEVRIGAALARDDIDWSSPPRDEPLPQLHATVTVTGKQPIAAGEAFGLTVAVENRGSQTAHRVHAITDCVHDELDGIEIMFGAIAAGATVTRDVKLHVMPWHSAFTDAIDVDVHVGLPGAEPDAEARAMFEIVGAPRPSLAYEYWIVDDPALAAVAPARPLPEDGSALAPMTVTGNGDGMLQPGERVLLAYVAHNFGPGTSPDTRALVRNSSGRQGLLEEGFASLGALAPGAHVAGAFGLTIHEDADRSVPLELELVLGDATLRTAAQDQLRFRVLEAAERFVPGRGAVRVGDEAARLYEGAHPSAPIGATAKTGDTLAVVGTLGGYHVIDGGGQGRRLFLPSTLVGLTPAPAKASVVAPQRRVQVRPPQVELRDVPLSTTAAVVQVRGTVTHPERARDVVVLVRPPGTAQVDHKVHYQANDATTGEAARRLEFEAAVPLEPGGNRISVLARDGAKVVQRHDVWIYRAPAP